MTPPTPPTPPHQETEPLLPRYRRPGLGVFVVVLLIGVIIGCLGDRAYNKILWLNWAKEEEHRASVRAQWRDEKAVMDAERKMWEEELERQRGQLVWEDVQPGRCLRYATRGYKATLSNIRFGVNALAECYNKTLRIHGRDVLPSVCDIEVNGVTHYRVMFGLMYILPGIMWTSDGTLDCRFQ